MSIARPRMKTANRRENPRINAKLRCHITSLAPWSQSAIYTESINRRGVLLDWDSEDSAPAGSAVGHIVTLQIELPAHHASGQKWIHCQGKCIRTVIRVTERKEDGTQAALPVNYMDFRSFHGRLWSFEASQPVAMRRMA